MPIIAGATVKPDLRVEHPDFGDITEDVARELALMRQEDHRRLVLEAEQCQRAITQARPGEAKIQKAFALKAEIDPRVHAYWRMREGPGFWKHELDWFLKKNPQCRVKSVSANPSIIHPGLPAGAARRGPVGKRGRWAA